MDALNSQIPFYPPPGNALPQPPPAPQDEGSHGIIDKVHLSVKNALKGVKDTVGKMAEHTAEGIGKTIDPALYQDKIEIPLEHKSYNNISIDDAAKMMGYFTQKMQNQGFPWSLHEVTGKSLKKRHKISEFEALARLQKGQEVLFQPRRSMQFDLSPDNLSAVSKIGGDQLKPVDTMANLSKTTKVSANDIGIEVTFGAPVVIKSFGELKLLHQLYNPDMALEKEKPPEPSPIILPGGFKKDQETKPTEAENVLGKTAHNLSYFTRKTMGSTHPWRFVKEGTTSSFMRVLKSMIYKGIPGALIGAGVGFAVGGPIGLFTGSWAAALTMSSYGAAAGGGLMALQGSRDALKGEEINAYEATARILEEKPVTFQERKKHSISLPIMGSFTWFSDYGKGSVISTPKELEFFTKMQDQE
ncbi:MAG: hypothetical protein RDV48_20660 [Candidatus Eremiobacteraeota bacterium]|nr:hypothetical protein [Candidatus Eremiobacteraeota bacterium]